ncbi:hypothetical protein CUC04_02980 [Prevotella intermedia]|uniref:Uncharacterized protein n=1 Tax=Prevotella intermedia TaxID=28131 RepID=A0A2G9IFA4_PREIN|nr:hypothetical protein CUC04_02980 [Prevotella intermedia]
MVIIAWLFCKLLIYNYKVTKKLTRLPTFKRTFLTRTRVGEYINSKAGEKRIKKQWKNRKKKEELYTFKEREFDIRIE